MIGETINAYCDGGSRGNPGFAAAAFVIRHGNKTLHKEAKFLGVTTNNVAEYFSLILALKWLVKNANGVLVINIFLDSELVVNQITKNYKVKSKKLKPLNKKANDLLNKLSTTININSVPRNKNMFADSLVNDKLDEKL